MAYTVKELNRVIELFEKIQANKPHENAAPTYKDSPALKEIAAIMLSRNDKSEETLSEKISGLSFVAECYRAMGRPALSAKYYEVILECHVALLDIVEYSPENMEDYEGDIYQAFKVRNHYESDDCKDLIEIIGDTLPKEKVTDIYNKAVASKPFIKNDPIEKTDAYLMVIDEVEEEIDKNKTMDFCLEYWSLKKEYLAERGIDWKSPSQLNPGVMFD